jgi:hypothetical protein
MATIVTVHGTFDSGPESGQRWWQRGSQFETQLRGLVEGDDGKADFVRHIWNGLNSEISRRSAGRTLCKCLVDLEKKGERYCLISHSHGGSVILSALMLSTYRRRALPGLSRWITVGAPFITFARKRLLFSRLGLFGKGAYLSAFTVLCLLGLNSWLFLTDTDSVHIDTAVGGSGVAILIFLLVEAIFSWSADRGALSYEDFSRSIAGDPVYITVYHRLVYLAAVGAALAYTLSSDSPQNLAGRFITASIFLVGLYFLIAGIDRLGSKLIGARRSGDGAKNASWQSLWISLRHSQDEAVEGLRQLPSVSFPIFGRDFAVAPLTLASALAFPILIIAALFSPTLMHWWGAMETLPPNIKISPISTFLRAPYPLIAPVSNALEPPLFASRMIAIFFEISFYVLAAIAFVAVMRHLASTVSWLLSAILNKVAWHQIQDSAYGNDTPGEVSKSASDAPRFTDPRQPLPHDLAAEISKFADTAIAKSASKVRASFNRLAFGRDKKAHSDLIAEYLTWDELIHTAYFKVALFNKLIAYAIAHSKGFRPSALFLADPDYNRVAGWYEELTGATAGERKDGAIGSDVKAMEPAISA